MVALRLEPSHFGSRQPSGTGPRRHAVLPGLSTARLTSHPLPTPLWPPFCYLSPSATQHPTFGLVHQSPKMTKFLSPLLLTTPSSFENYKPPFCPVLKTTRHDFTLLLTRSPVCVYIVRPFMKSKP